MSNYRLKDSTLVPPTGFAYTQPETGSEINGGSLYDTIQLTQLHRQANGLSRQSWEEINKDVQTQLCQLLGHDWCRHIKADSWGFNTSWDSIKAGTRTLAAWAAEAARGGNPYVSQEEAELRAEICAKCFANKRFGGCISCGFMNLLTELVSETPDPGKTKNDDRLNSCMICSCLLRKKVWIRADIIAKGMSEKQREAYSEIPTCWQNNI